MNGHQVAVGTALAQRPTGARPRDRRRGSGEPVTTTAVAHGGHAAVHGQPTRAGEQPTDLVHELRSLRESVQRSVDLHGAYRSSAAERAARITQLHGELDEERAAVAALRAADVRHLARVADLERRLASAVRRARTAEGVADDLRERTERLDARARRLSATVATLETTVVSLEGRQRRSAREQQRHERLRRRRSVRLALWCLDRPSVRYLLRLAGAVER